MKNGAWTPWDMARFAAVEEYDNLRLRNERSGIGNSHLLDPIEFVRLMNRSGSTFDPYRYMEEVQEKRHAHAAARRLTLTEYVETDDEQKSSQENVVAEQQSSVEESSQVPPPAVEDRSRRES